MARIAENRRGHGPFARIEPMHQPLGDGGRQLVEQGGAVVGVQIADDVRDLLGAQRGDQLGLVGCWERLEDSERHGLAEHAKQDRGLGRRARLDEVDELPDGQGLRLAGELLELGFVLRLAAQEGKDGVDGRAGRSHGAIVTDGRNPGVRRCERRDRPTSCMRS